MREQIKDALIMGYQGEIARANANIEVYMGEKKILSLILE